jgi:deoxyribonuclease V
VPDLDIPDLFQELHTLLDQVPAGKVTTCGALAAALGNPIAARWIGQFLARHDHDPACNCHRVLRARGLLGPYIEGPAAKRRRLQAEGIEIHNETVDLASYACTSLECSRPLQRLQRVQEAICRQVRLRPCLSTPRLVGGVDVSYPNCREGVAAYALVDTDRGQLVWSTTLRRQIAFPYITSYLSFRELPILIEVLTAVRAAGRLAPVVLVDGSGILHQRRAGIASHLGVVAGLPTIGVTKRLLCGRVESRQLEPLESLPVVHEDRLIGIALRPTAGSKRPIFISPGHRVDVSFAERVVRLMLRGHRLPEPLFWADRISRQSAVAGS